MLRKLLKPQFVHLVCQTDFNNHFSPVHQTTVTVAELNLALANT